MRWQLFSAQRAALATVAGILVAFLAIPVLALFVTITGAEVAAGLRHPLVWPALRLSLQTSTASLFFVVLTGTPLAWALAQARGGAARVIETFIQLPIVVPPAVAGVALLLAFGRRGLLAGWLYPEGWSVTFTTAAVVIAEAFVSAPFYTQAAISAFRRIDPRLLVVARSFGALPLRVFFRVAVPIAAPGLAAGAAMSWARSLGEFGATLMFAGNLRGETQTLPLAIYSALEADLRVAQALSILLVVTAFALLFVVRIVSRRWTEAAERS